MLFSWRNSQSKMATFHNFWKTWKNPLLNGWFLPLESVKIIFLWAHLHRLSERIILDLQTFIRDSRGWFLAMIPKCPLESRNSHSTHFHSRSVKFKENIPIQSTALGEKKLQKNTSRIENQGSIYIFIVQIYNKIRKEILRLVKKNFWAEN